MLITSLPDRGIIKLMKKTNLFYTTFLVSFLLVGAGIAQAVSLPDFSQINDLPGFISSIYSFALTVVGIAVFIRILHAGFLMLTAGGNASKWNDAKTKMTNAIVGAILLFAAYLILFVINPDLVKNTFNFSLSATAPVTGGSKSGGGESSGNSEIKTYTCNENGQCVEDPDGEYDTPDCDNECQ